MSLLQGFNYDQDRVGKSGVSTLLLLVHHIHQTLLPKLQQILDGHMRLLTMQTHQILYRQSREC